MFEAKPTPGPWHVGPDGRQVFAADDAMIADATDTYEGLEGECPEADENARLIAAAPALLAACESLLVAADATQDDQPHRFLLYDAWQNIRAAVTLARGQSPVPSAPEPKE